MSQTPYDLVVIGAGPGGYVAAIRAAQLGMRVAVVEREHLGGICLNWGCIPTKALLKSAEVLETCKKAADFGVSVDNIRFDFSAMVARSRKVASTMERGIGFLLKKNKIDHLIGTAKILAAKPNVKLSITPQSGAAQEVSAARVIIATGARPRPLPGVVPDGKTLWTSREAMIAKEVPKKLAILGAGAIGVEFASFYRSVGSEVTLIEYQSQLMPLEDHEIAEVVAKSFKKRGIVLKLATKVESATPSANGCAITISPVAGGPSETLEFDRALLAAGIAPNTEGLGLEAVGVKLDAKGFIEISETTYETSTPGIFAIGDVTGPPALAHTASQEGVVAVERMAGKSPQPIDYDRIVACTFCHPEVGSIGLTEARAKSEKREVRIGRFPFRALGKAVAAGEVEGLVKVIYDAKHGELLGAHIVGPGATDLIAELSLVHGGELTAHEVVSTIHAHPTLAEAVKEATEDALGHAIHI